MRKVLISCVLALSFWCTANTAQAAETNSAKPVKITQSTLPLASSLASLVLASQEYSSALSDLLKANPGVRYIVSEITVFRVPPTNISEVHISLQTPGPITGPGTPLVLVPGGKFVGRLQFSPHDIFVEGVKYQAP